MSKWITSALPPHASQTAAPALPARPNLEHLKKLAKQRLKMLRSKDAAAKLADAQRAIAREHGFASWRAMKAAVDLFAAAAAASPKLRGDRLNALLVAVGQGNTVVVRALLAIDPSLVNESGPHPFWGGRPQPLHVAIERGDDAMFRVLLDSGADINGQNDAYDRWSPLMLAVHWKRGAMRDELLCRGARVGLVEVLMLGDDRRIASILRDDPGIVARPVANEASPLHFARTIKAVKLLLGAGARADVLDKYGKTAAELAAGRGDDPKLVQLLLGGGQRPEGWMLAGMGRQPAFAAAARKNPSILRDPAVLKAAVERGHVGLVKWLLDKGVDAAARTPTGATMLHIAAWEGHLPIARLLVERGADPNLTEDQHHATAAQWARHAASHHNRPSCLAVAEYLQSVGDGA